MGKKKPKKEKKEKKEPAKAAAKNRDKKAKRTKKEQAVAAEQPTVMSHEQRLEMIRTAAYYLAEKRRFSPGSEAEDWREAEKEIEERFPFRR